MTQTESGFFSPENAVTGTAARRALNGLARLTGRVDLMRDHDDQVEASRVIDLVIRNRAIQLELDQPIGQAADTPCYAVGDALLLYWSDDGMRYGTRAVVAQVDCDDAKPSYLLDVGDVVYREEERRVADRIPIDESDGIKATLSCGTRRAQLNPVVEDISAGGVRLSLSVRAINQADLEPRMNATLSLTLPTASDALRTHITIAWMQQINEQRCDFGCFWRQPPDNFLEPLQRFIAMRTPDDESSD